MNSEKYKYKLLAHWVHLTNHAAGHSRPGTTHGYTCGCTASSAFRIIAHQLGRNVARSWAFAACGDPFIVTIVDRVKWDLQSRIAPGPFGFRYERRRSSAPLRELPTEPSSMDTRSRSIGRLAIIPAACVSAAGSCVPTTHALDAALRSRVGEGSELVLLVC
jgi:hypothetical protein